MGEKINKYIPDALILIGFWVFIYNIYFPVKTAYIVSGVSSYDYRQEVSFIGLVLISIGLTLAIRRYFKK